MDSVGGLLIRLTKLHRALISTRLATINLYPSQDGLLYHLSINDGLTMSDLVEKMKIKHPTLFTMTQRMEVSGLIKKGKDKTDKRTSRIYLTSLGRSKITELSQVWRTIEEQLVKDFTEQEKNEAKSILSKLLINLESN